MRIENLRKEIFNGMPRICATVICEHFYKKPLEIYFETEQEFESDLWPNPNAFLLATFVVAMHFGERRIKLEGPVCPVLYDGLNVAMRLLKFWHGAPDSIVEIESEQGFSSRLPAKSDHTASLLSGGIDSLAALRHNRMQFPLEHPQAIRDCFLVYGLDIGDPNE